MIFKTDRDRMLAYRNAFTTPQNVQVLVDILGTLGFWDTCTSNALTPEEQNVLNIHAKKILEKCGFWKPENYSVITQNMLGIIPKKRRRWWQKK